MALRSAQPVKLLARQKAEGSGQQYAQPIDLF
jgi:hypothetical protein